MSHRRCNAQHVISMSCRRRQTIPAGPRNMKRDMDRAGAAAKHFLHRVVIRPVVEIVINSIGRLPLYENQGHGWRAEA